MNVEKDVDRAGNDQPRGPSTSYANSCTNTATTATYAY